MEKKLTDLITKGLYCIQTDGFGQGERPRGKGKGGIGVR